MTVRRFDTLPVWLRLAVVMGVTAVLAVGAGYLVGHTAGPPALALTDGVRPFPLVDGNPRSQPGVY